MGRYVANAAIRKMIEAGQAPKKSHVVILGLTFKENCPDIRNSKVADILQCFQEFGIEPTVVDPWAKESDTLKEYGVTLTRLEEVKHADCVIVAVAHEEFKKLGLEEIKSLYHQKSEKEGRVLIDVKGIYDIAALEESGLNWWRL